MKILEKIRSQSETKKKIILWSMLIAAGAGLLALYFINIRKNIEKLKSVDLKEYFGAPELREELKNLPKIEMPEVDEEELKKIEEQIEEEIEKNEEK